MGQSVVKNPKKLYSQLGGDPTLPSRVTTLENNEYKITYYEVVSGASGSLTLPTGATINSGEFGLSGNCVLSKIDGSNKPTFESPKTAGGTVVTASLNVSNGAWVASGVYTDTNVALIYSIKIKAIYYSNLTYANIIETVADGSAYIKNLTSDAQTQLDSKGYLVSFKFYATLNPADATTYYPSLVFASGITAGGARSRHKVLKSGGLIDVNWTHSCTAGTSESVTLQLHNITQATSVTVTSSLDLSSATANNQYLNNVLAYTVGDLIEVRIVCPTWATNPTNLVFSFDLKF